MRINYKEPYWIKFKWDMSSHHENQYVTEFNKSNNDELNHLFHNKNFILTVHFSVNDEYQKDEICMIYGKPGKNIGLSYNQTTKTTAFEFWTKSDDGDKFNMIVLKDVTLEDVNNGVIISLVRNNDEITIYKNFVLTNTFILENDFIDDYKIPGLFVGASYPQSDIEKNRYYCEFDIFHLSYIVNDSDINIISNIFNMKTQELVNVKYYNKILFYYNFNCVNNIGIIYDESKYTNFMEKVPKEYVK